MLPTTLSFVTHKTSGLLTTHIHKTQHKLKNISPHSMLECQRSLIFVYRAYEASVHFTLNTPVLAGIKLWVSVSSLGCFCHGQRCQSDNKLGYYYKKETGNLPKFKAIFMDIWI